ncbi:hypothetical protein D1871_21805, partial [Nakamurella silvestris]
MRKALLMLNRLVEVRPPKENAVPVAPGARRRPGRMALALTAAALMVTSSLGVPAWAAEAGLPDPVLNLKFEDNTADSSSKANNATLKGHNGSTTLNYEYMAGVAAGSKALKLKGNTYLDLGTSIDLQPQDLTLSFWINPTATMAGEQVISWNKQAYNTDGWYLSSESNTVPLAISIGPATGQPYKVRVSSADRAAFFPAGQWTHVVVTYDHTSKGVSFYRNGEPVSSTVANAVGVDGATGVLGSSAALPKTIGFNGPQYKGSYLVAGLDEYRLYNGIANLGEVVSLYEESGRTIDRQAIAQSDADGLTLPESATIGLVLSSAGSRGSTIQWVSSNPGVIDSLGTVKRPEEGQPDAVVTLTAKVSYAAGPVVQRQFQVTVPAQQLADLLEDSGLDTVLLSGTFLNNAAAKEHEYLLSLSSEKFLFEFYKVSGLTPTTTSGYAGWERSNATNFRGHAFGHYMSALAQSYISTTDATTKAGLLAQITAAVNGLKKSQDAYAVGHPASAGYVSAFRESILDKVQGTGSSDENVLVPWYNLHKILAGLLDISEFVDGPLGDQALAIADQFGEYVYNRVSKLTNVTTLLSTEYGGMNEALYELYDITGNPHYKKAAEAFDETTLFRQLAAGTDVLDGRHANTTIPKLIGALKRYTVLTQNESYYAALTDQEKRDLPMYLTAAQNFWKIVIDHHTYVTGSNSQSEHFHGADLLYAFAANQGDSGNAQTSETCNEYNMLKLSRELFKLTKDVKYADYYENTFINTILSSQNPETGMTTYFQPMAPGYQKVFGLPFTEFWCCIGTGMENFSKLGDSIYFTGGKSVYVNMFFSSTFDYTAQNLRLKQVANMPNSDTVTFTVDAVDGGAVKAGTTLRLRVPNWIAGSPTVVVNGQTVTATVSGGYLLLPNVAKGDVITYTMPMKVVASATQDNKNFVAFKYGPVVLSAKLTKTNMDTTRTVGVLVRVGTVDPAAQSTITAKNVTAAQWKADVAQNVVRIADSSAGLVQFKLNNTADAGDLVFTPHYRNYQERYGLYMFLEEPDSQASQDRIRQDKQNLREVEVSVDSLTSFDGNNFEADKNMKASANSTIGLWQARPYRDALAGGWFSYDLAIDPTQAKNYLQVTYYSGDKGRSFDVYVNDEKLKTTTLTDTAGTNVFYPDTTEIPAKYLTVNDQTRYKTNSSGDFVLDDAGKKIPVVTVRFQSTGGLVGGVYGIHIKRSTVFDTDPALSALTFDKGSLAPAFTSAQKDYTLTVPTKTAEVHLFATPHLPSGLVLANGILFDNTQDRIVPVPNASTTLTLKAYAQDHTTATTYTVTVVKVDIPDPAPQFTDVPAGSQFYADIRWMAEKRISTGTASGDAVYFKPGEAVSRQAFAAFLYRLDHDGAKAPACSVAPYADVPTGAEFCGEISWLKSKNITNGFAGNTFKPGASIERQAMAAFLYRYSHPGAAAPG